MQEWENLTIYEQKLKFQFLQKLWATRRAVALIIVE